MANKQSVRELAKQGNSKAIAALIKKSLSSKGVSLLKFSLKEGCFKILVESSEAVDQDELVEFVRKCLIKLESPYIKEVKIYGKQASKDTSKWYRTFNLNTQDNFQTDSLQFLLEKKYPKILDNETKRTKYLSRKQEESVSNTVDSPNNQVNPTPDDLNSVQKVIERTAGCILGFCAIGFTINDNPIAGFFSLLLSLMIFSRKSKINFFSLLEKLIRKELSENNKCWIVLVLIILWFWSWFIVGLSGLFTSISNPLPPEIQRIRNQTEEEYLSCDELYQKHEEGVEEYMSMPIDTEEERQEHIRVGQKNKEIAEEILSRCK